MNSRSARKKVDEAKNREFALVTESETSDEDVIFNGRITRHGRFPVQPKKEEGHEEIQALKDLGMYEEGMTLEEMRATLDVIAESKETAETEKSLRSKYEEWEETVLDGTSSEKEPETPNPSQASSHGPLAEESEELFTKDVPDVSKNSSPQAESSKVGEPVPFCPSDDDETMLCSPILATQSPAPSIELNEPSSPVLLSGPSSPVNQLDTTKLARQTSKPFVSLIVSESSDSELEENLPKAASVSKVAQKTNNHLISTKSEGSTPVKGSSPQPSSSDSGDSDIRDHLKPAWNANTLVKRVKKLSNRPKHKVPYYRLPEIDDKNPKEYTNVIVQAFTDYFNLYSKFQKTVEVKSRASWGKPVQAGSHHEGTLDLKNSKTRLFNFKKYMNIVRNENSQNSNTSDTETEDDFTPKKETKAIEKPASVKCPVESSDLYEFTLDDDDDNIAIESSPPPVSFRRTSAEKDQSSGWLSTRYKRQLSLEPETKSTQPSKTKDTVLPSNFKLLNKPNVTEPHSKRRKLLVTAPRSYDTDDSDKMELVTVSDGMSTVEKENNSKSRNLPHDRTTKSSVRLGLSKRKESIKPSLSDLASGDDSDSASRDEEATEELVACPMCERLYNKAQVGYHAATCEGKAKQKLRTASKNGCRCFVCKEWFSLVHYKAHVSNCVQKHSSTPLPKNEVTLLVGEKDETVSQPPTGSILLDSLSNHDETSRSVDSAEKFRLKKGSPDILRECSEEW